MATSVTFSTVNLPLISQGNETKIKFAKYAYFQIVLYWFKSASIAYAGNIDLMTLEGHQVSIFRVSY